MTLAEVLRTAAEVYEPDDAIGLAGLLIIGLPGILAAFGTIFLGWITVHGRRAGREVNKAIRDDVTVIRREVKNDHPDDANLRDDVDEIRELVKDISDRQLDQSRDIRGIRTDVGELRGADRDAARHQREFEQRVQSAFRREHPDADPL